MTRITIPRFLELIYFTVHILALLERCSCFLNGLNISDIDALVSTANSVSGGASNLIYRSSCRRDALFKLTDRNKKLQGQASNLIGSSHEKSLSLCVKSCVQPSGCRSINYKSDPTSEADKNCQLLNITKSDSSALLIEAAGWKHYEPVSQTSPRCRLVTCDPGYSCFDTCQKLEGYVCNEIDECLSTPCQNGGSCDNLINKYKCSCAPGWEGTNCEININECASNPCQNGGTCKDEINKYNCTCAAGYTGLQCETNINECASTPCKNGGSCKDEINKYTCTCAAGYTGLQCETNINECASNPCQNGGACKDEINKYTCTCAAGYTGLQCETNINECASNPCQNGGACTDEINKYTCTCAAGYTGLQCETNINECASTPCKNGGSCKDEINKYTCTCAAGYTGAQCETNINECASSPCLNGGTCADGVNKYTCTCTSGYKGDRCGTVSLRCADKPCQNGGTCTTSASGDSCTCITGFIGIRCETNVNECSSSPCRNGGTCKDGINSYACICSSHWGGIQCELSSKISSCKQLKLYHGYTSDSVYTLWTKAGTSSYNAYCNMAYGGWTLIARFSNADGVNWMAPSGSFWYDASISGSTTSPSTNADMLSPAFQNARGDQFKITRSDNTYHNELVYTTTSCLMGQDFRSFITAFGNFRSGASWGQANACRYSCQVQSYNYEYASTQGFSKASCSSDLQASNKIGFWCHYSSGDGAVIMIGGGGSACGRADHGLAITEENYPNLGTSAGASDFGDESGQGTNAYALNLWVI